MVRRPPLIVAMLALGCGSTGVTPAEDASIDVPLDVSFDIAAEDLPIGPAIESLEIAPSRSVAFINRVTHTPAKQTYVANLMKDDGTSIDVTTATSFMLDEPTLGAFSGATFTSVTDLPGSPPPIGVVIRVIARYAKHTSIADLVVVALDPTKDLFFVVPYKATPTPTHQVMRVVGGSSPLDLSIALTIEPNPDGATVDSFVKTVRAMPEGDPKSGCAPRTAKDTNGDGILDTFPAVEASGVVCFDVTAMTVVSPMPSYDPKFYAVHADVVGGTVKLDRHTLFFLLPAVPRSQ